MVKDDEMYIKPPQGLQNTICIKSERRSVHQSCHQLLIFAHALTLLLDDFDIISNV